MSRRWARAAEARWWGAGAFALLTAGLVAWAPWAGGPPGEGGKGFAVAAPVSRSIPAAPPVTTPAAVVPATPATGWIATLSAAVTYSGAPGGAVVGTIAAANPFGGPTALAVIGRPDPSGWLHVELPVRPNGSSGWIPASSATLTWTSYQVQISLAAHTVTVLNGTQIVLTVSAAVGAPKTSTPVGNTYLWELIRPDNPSGAYGPYIFGLAMFSDVYSVFNGGDAQIGMHGNDDISSIGHPVSHGCIRLDNATITKLSMMLPLGTPVTIS